MHWMRGCKVDNAFLMTCFSCFESRWGLTFYVLEKQEKEGSNYLL